MQSLFALLMHAPPPFFDHAAAAVAFAEAAPTVCGARGDLVTHLDKKFGEQRNNLMLDARGNLVEMFSNHETGSWTLTVTVPGGPTCVLSSGESFVREIRAAKVEERGS